MKFHFSIQQKRLFLAKFFIFFIFTILILVIDKKTDYLKPVRYYLSFITTPVEQAVLLPDEIYDWFKDKIITKETLLEQKSLLEIENALLKAKIKQYIALELENIRLRSMLNASYEIESSQLLIAKIINSNNSLTKRSISVNKGSLNNVYLGQPVLDSEGIMGQVIDVKPMSATVLLINDYDNYTPVMIKNSGRKLLARGNKDNLLIENISNIQGVEIGNELITSGLSGLYPTGYPVATVSKISASENVTNSFDIQADIKAALDLNQEVILIWTDNKKNLYQIASQSTLIDQKIEPTQNSSINQAINPDTSLKANNSDNE